MATLLDIYLNDHLAGATLGVELARRLRSGNRDQPAFGSELAEICAGIEADRETLEAVMDKLGVRRSKLKPAAALPTTYDFDDAGRLIERDDGSVESRYGWDQLDQLTSVDNNRSLSIDYTYKCAGPLCRRDNGAAMNSRNLY